MIHPIRSRPDTQTQTLVVAPKQIAVVKRHLAMGQRKNPMAFGAVIARIGVEGYRVFDPFVLLGLELDRYQRVIDLVGGRKLRQIGLIPRNLQFASYFKIIFNPSVGTPPQSRQIFGHLVQGFQIGHGGD